MGEAFLGSLSRWEAGKGGRLMDARIQPPARDEGMPQAVAGLKRELKRRNIELVYCPDGTAAVAYLLSRIPSGATVMNGGSTTLEQIGFLEALKGGPYDWLRPRVKAVNDPEERTRARRRATIADYFVRGINAVTEAGEIVNADGSGNRTSPYPFGAGRLFLVARGNKIVPDIAP